MISSGAGAAGSAVANVATSVVSGIFFGGFNPKYKKEDQKRMRYIQLKYAQAYGDQGVESPDVVIHRIDPNSKLKMTPDGVKPANPFPDERAFDEALIMNFHPGRFAASHAEACLGKIIEYQCQRRERFYVPGLSTSGRPNDYINMFLEEMKTWCRAQLMLDNVSAEELQRRVTYITKLKHDRYYWCFPEEIQEFKIQQVIDFLHDKISEVLEIVSREEKNKSLQALFKELNDHTTNAFEFGKNYLGYLLSASKKVGADLLHSKKFNGDSYETGYLHHMLVDNTEAVMKMYLADMKNADQAIENASPENIRDGYVVTYSAHETSMLNAVKYHFIIEDKRGIQWLIEKSPKDFYNLHQLLIQETRKSHLFQLPDKLSRFASENDILNHAEKYINYLQTILDDPRIFSKDGQAAICSFLQVKELDIPTSTAIVHPETIENTFLKLKEDFRNVLITANKDDKMLSEFHQTWGSDWVLKIYDAYGLLQRMASILSWTLEINHFFISMFGNTLVFSKLPLREVLHTLRDLMVNFMSLTKELFEHTCRLNEKAQYKWHKNLQTAEQELHRMTHHVTTCIALISRIDIEHLDRETQMKRLQQVAARFQPLLTRLDMSLPNIRSELNLPAYDRGQDELGNLDSMLLQDEPKVLLIEDGEEVQTQDRKIESKESNNVRDLGAKQEEGTRVEIVDESSDLVVPVAESKNDDCVVTSGDATESTVCIIS